MDNEAARYGRFFREQNKQVYLLKIIFILVVLSVAGSTGTVAQDSTVIISGRVTDTQSGKPLQDVNVYLYGTTSGEATDSAGYYQFRTAQLGSRQLVASFVGYQPKNKTVTIGSNRSYQFNFKLKQNPIGLDEVEVTASNREWKRNYKYFQEMLLGYSPYKRPVRIKNPFVLEFNTEDDFKATALEALQIDNYALGYYLIAELVTFNFKTTHDTGIYRVLPYFKPMKAADEEVQKKWEQNRRKAYLGSMRHYLKSLYHGKVSENDFYQDPTSPVDLIGDEDGTASRILLSRGIYGVKDLYKVFKFNAYKVEVGYKVQRDRGGHITNKGDLSYLYAGNKDQYFIINSQGHLLNIKSIRVAGKWARDRVAKLLPLDYSPNQD